MYTKDDRNTNTSIKWGGTYDNGKVTKPDVETDGLTGDYAPQGLVS